MLYSKIFNDLKHALPHHRVLRTRHAGTQEFRFEPRDGHRKIQYIVIEYRDSTVLRNLNTGLEKSYPAHEKESLLCMLQQVQKRQIKKSYDGSGRGNENTVRNFCNVLGSCISLIKHVKPGTLLTVSGRLSMSTKYS